MRDSALYQQWLIGLGIAAALVIVAAALLIMVILAAKRIQRLAAAALGLVVQIKENTDSIWALQQTNSVAVGILEEAEEIKTHAVMVVGAMHEADQSNTP